MIVPEFKVDGEGSPEKQGDGEENPEGGETAREDNLDAIKEDPGEEGEPKQDSQEGQEGEGDEGELNKDINENS
jgi:hypothetical protein